MHNAAQPTNQPAPLLKPVSTPLRLTRLRAPTTHAAAPKAARVSGCQPHDVVQNVGIYSYVCRHSSSSAIVCGQKIWQGKGYAVEGFGRVWQSVRVHEGGGLPIVAGTQERGELELSRVELGLGRVRSSRALVPAA